jgi:hypothetical protein
MKDHCDQNQILYSEKKTEPTDRTAMPLTVQMKKQKTKQMNETTTMMHESRERLSNDHIYTSIKVSVLKQSKYENPVGSTLEDFM